MIAALFPCFWLILTPVPLLINREVSEEVSWCNGGGKGARNLQKC